MKDRTAIISGGLGDIGAAIALEFARRGAAIAVGDLHDPDRADRLLTELRAAGARCTYDRVDVCDGGSVEQWIDRAAVELGVPTIVIPNAAIVTVKPILDMEPDEWERELRTNLTGAFHVARYAATRMVRSAAAGHIVFIGSWAANAVHTALPAYCVTKAGVRMLMQCMAMELARSGILVNEVAPGYVDAGLSGKIFDADPTARERARSNVPLKRLIAPADVAAQVAHLCEASNRHITGAALVMDGGLSLMTPGTGQ